MTILTRAVAIGDTELKIDAAMTAAFPGFVKIGSEFLAVGGAEYRVGTTLTLSEPARATHTDGSTVTYAGRFLDPTFSAALGAGGGAAEAGTVVTISATDPGGIGWWIRSESVLGPGGTVYGLFYRADELDPWARMNIGWWEDGVLRAFIGSADNGFDILTYDDNGDQRFNLESSSEDGSFTLKGNSADGFTNTSQVTYDETAGSLTVDLVIANGQAGSLYMDATAVILARAPSVEEIILSATGIAITTAGTLTYNGDEVAVVP